MLQKFNPKNKDLQVYINGQLYHRDEAKVSVFDSIVQGGDGVWEGLRVYDGKIFCLDRHLDRLQNSAKAMLFHNVPSNETLIEAVKQTLKANNMTDGVHIRLTLTRGEKITSGMDPRLNQKGLTLIILPEFKMPVYPEEGVQLITASIRRNSPMCIDSKIHHNNLINNILAKIESNLAGADAAIMLDIYGFVAEVNGTNIFMVKNGHLFTPHADACLPGVTRGVVIEIAKALDIPFTERNVSISEFHSADEAFMTGTMGEITPINKIDGRIIGDGSGQRPICDRIQAAFEERTEKEGTSIL